MTPHDIAADLLHRIARGELRPGQPLPTIRQLQDRYDASRHEVGQARRLLVAHGAIELRRGAGAIVLPGAATAPGDPLPELEELRSRLAREIDDLRTVLADPAVWPTPPDDRS
ncbi:winged helix-turn-helix domain-containing protein [Nocardioides sp. SYSU DS0651]|uniref:winged helix-turn-helix domain-containing protein n=1 Tax=Nocardioides sp. SYSU DS0651 TaxID=3415955 RepID=UPI003F4BB6D8